MEFTMKFADKMKLFDHRNIEVNLPHAFTKKISATAVEITSLCV